MDAFGIFDSRIFSPIIIEGVESLYILGLGALLILWEIFITNLDLVITREKEIPKGIFQIY